MESYLRRGMRIYFSPPSGGSMAEFWAIALVVFVVAGTPVSPRTVAYFNMEYKTEAECVEMKSELAKTMSSPIREGTKSALTCIKVKDLDRENEL